MLFVCAAGNAGSKGTSYPAGFGLANVISVGSLGKDGNKSTFSQNGSSPDIYACGENILTVGGNQDYVTVSGTSFSAPQVTAAAAIVKAIVPNISSGQLKTVIKESSSMNVFGLPVVNPQGAAKLALPLLLMEDMQYTYAMAITGKMLTPEIAELLLQNLGWENYSEEKKTVLLNFFGISANSLASALLQKTEVIEAVNLALTAKYAGITIEQANQIFGDYTIEKRFSQV